MYTNSPRFFGAHQDDSHKVENDQSVKYREGKGSILGASLEEVELKLNFRF